MNDCLFTKVWSKMTKGREGRKSKCKGDKAETLVRKKLNSSFHLRIYFQTYIKYVMLNILHKIYVI